MKATILGCTLLLAIALNVNSAHAADRAGADALAGAGAALVAKGNVSQAKDMFYKALANDENCPEAIFELAKIFEKENAATSAGDFYQRAFILMAQENKPTTIAKRAEAERRVKALNPFAPRISAIFEDYADSLDKLVKKVPDSVTLDATVARVDELKMASIVQADKMPKFYAGAHAKKVADQVAASHPPTTTRSGFSSIDSPAKPVNNVPPDVERELKALGWTIITGTWVKKSTGVYEATNGKLEAAKVVGGVDVLVHKIASSASVRAAVRNESSSSSDSSIVHSSSSFFSGSDYAGFGVTVRSKDARLSGPAIAGGFMMTNGNKYEPSSIRTETLPDAASKTHVTTTITDDTLELSVNEKKSFRFKDAKMPKVGSFMIQINGTATIENPRCVGN